MWETGGAFAGGDVDVVEVFSGTVLTGGFQLGVVGGWFDGLCLGEVWCLIFHFDRLCRSAIPVGRVVIHGVVRERSGMYEAARRSKA